MQVEIQVALNFLVSYLYNKLPRRRVNMFAEALEKGLLAKFEGHWYPEKPFKGSGYRCVRISTTLDPVVLKACDASGLDITDVKGHLPEELSIWVDPKEVSYRMGERGPVKILYAAAEEEDVACDKEVISSSGFNPDAQVFRPIENTLGTLSPEKSPSPSSGMMFSSSSVSPTIFQRNNTPTMTTAEFAQTKFGSTKPKTQKKSGPRMSPTEYMKQKASQYPTNVPTNKPARALSPNAKEFVYNPQPKMMADTLGFNNLFIQDTFGFGLGGFDQMPSPNNLNDSAKSYLDGLNFNLNTIQYPGQPYPQVMVAN
ncbi:protein Tob1-like [Branchiostoma lanceolatum]|uniref:protein Tob1-like n=1 Tax=Branchiostoma lanceolatum TaxID=7740 RepID=UPI003455753E